MPQWEYCIFSYFMEGPEGEPKRVTQASIDYCRTREVEQVQWDPHHMVNDALTTLGMDGWELVSVVVAGDRVRLEIVQHFFKRPLREE
ncbi:MAG: hypothetical protein U0X20_12295 [Caldilineaceae bacterium]